MSDAYGQLLDATIQHLEDLKSRGVRHVAVSPETLRALAQPVKSQISNLKSDIARTAAPMPTAKPTVQSAIRNPQSAIPAPVAEQEALLALPGETVAGLPRRSIRRRRPPRLPPCANARWPA